MATRSTQTTESALRIGSTDCGFVHSFDGGGISAAVIEESLTNVPFRKKHLGAVSYEDLVLEIGLGLEGAIYEWIAAWWVGIPQRRSGAVTTVDAALKPIHELAFFDALISETEIPALDGSSKESGFITVKLAPVRTEIVAKPSGIVPAGKAKSKWSVANFRLTIDGVETNRVSRIEPLKFRRVIETEAPAAGQAAGQPVVRVEVPNLKVTFSAASLGSWSAWFDEFVLKGANNDAGEKNGSIELLDPALKDVLARIDLFNLGIFRLAPIKTEGESIRRVMAEIYCERMVFSRLKT